jgi:hypothetical protein
MFVTSACVGEVTSVYRLLVGKAEAKKSLERHGLRWNGRMMLTFILKN